MFHLQVKEEIFEKRPYKCENMPYKFAWKILSSNLKINSSSKYLLPPWVLLYQSALLNLLCNTWKSKFSQTPLLKLSCGKDT